MKATVAELVSLKARIATAYAIQPLSAAQIARLATVDPSQVSRICRGEFKTISHNVVQICIVLDVAVGDSAKVASPSQESWIKMLASLRGLWDDTPEGAERISQILDAVAALRKPQ